MKHQKKQPAKKKSTSSVKKKTSDQPMRILLAVALLVVVITVSLVALVSLREKMLAPRSVPLYEEAVEDVTVEIRPVEGYGHADVIERLKELFLGNLSTADWRYLPSIDEVETLQISAAFPSSADIAEIAALVAPEPIAVHLLPVPEAGIIQIFLDNRLRLEFSFVEMEEPVSGRTRIAIIMDDLGGSLNVLQQVVDLGLSITPSILPGESRARASADLLRAAGHEYMIHIPMQPRRYPQTNPGADALLLSHSEQQIRGWMRHYIEQVPDAVGTNNHMGSRFTEEVDLMRIVLDELKRKNLFFIDSVTINSSVAFSQAKQMGIKTSARDIFLDNYEDVEYIRAQLRKMIQLAQNRSQVIAICHPYPETLEALRLEKAWLLKQPVEFVPASRLVRSYFER